MKNTAAKIEFVKAIRSAIENEKYAFNDAIIKIVNKPRSTVWQWLHILTKNKYLVNPSQSVYGKGPRYEELEEDTLIKLTNYKHIKRRKVSESPKVYPPTITALVGHFKAIEEYIDRVQQASYARGVKEGLNRTKRPEPELHVPAMSKEAADIELPPEKEQTPGWIQRTFGVHK